MISKRKQLFPHLRWIAYVFEQLTDDTNLENDLLTIKQVTDRFIRSLSKDTEKPWFYQADMRHPSGGLLRNNCSEPIPGAFWNHTVESVEVHTNLSEKCTIRGTISTPAPGRGDVVNGSVDFPFTGGVENSGSQGESSHFPPSNQSILQVHNSSNSKDTTPDKHIISEDDHSPKRRCNTFPSISDVDEPSPCSHPSVSPTTFSSPTEFLNLVPQN